LFGFRSFEIEVQIQWIPSANPLDWLPKLGHPKSNPLDSSFELKDSGLDRMDSKLETGIGLPQSVDSGGDSAGLHAGMNASEVEWSLPSFEMKDSG
jgi:hypothetical protein